MKSCFMIGHRDAGEAIYPSLREAVVRCIVEGAIDEFIVGHYGAFDRMAKRAVLEVKREYPARLTLLAPYMPVRREDAAGFDEIVYPFETYVPPRTAIVRANRMAIDGCACLIAYVRYPGNAADFLRYARKRDKTIILL